MSAAFDKCWHKGILAKLKQAKVDRSCLDLFTSYLENRKQCTVVENVKSKFQDVTAGVPQGSKLGPLLWILYCNDIVKDIESEILLFADDTCCFATGNDPAETALILNRDLLKISDWAKKWKVTFNPGKSKDMIFSQRKVLSNSPPLVFNTTFVERIHEHKHLGIYLSSNLSWSRQIHETCLKANRKLAVLRTVKYLKRSTLDILYKVCVRSTLEYGLVIYYHSLTLPQANRLSQIQYRAAKLCTGALHFTSQVKLETDLAWESIADRAKFLGLNIFHKIHCHETRPLVRNCMPQLNHGNTRAQGTYIKPKFISVGMSNSFFPHFAQQWSCLDKSTRNSDIPDFKSKVKSFLKPKRQKHYAVGDKYANSLLCRLRVGRSFLNSHGFAINLAATDKCSFCNKPETIKHYFFSCSEFKNQQTTLFAAIHDFLPAFSKKSIENKLQTLLYGIYLNSPEPDPRNKLIAYKVQNYILQTGRFSKAFKPGPFQPPPPPPPPVAQPTG